MDKNERHQAGGQSIVPPGSLLRLIKKPAGAVEWKKKIGRICRVGYYNKKDGLGIIWIVNQFGEYVEMIEQKDAGVYFEVVEFANERDFYGDNRPPLSRINEPSPEWQWSDK